VALSPSDWVQWLTGRRNADAIPGISAYVARIGRRYVAWQSVLTGVSAGLSTLLRRLMLISLSEQKELSWKTRGTQTGDWAMAQDRNGEQRVRHTR